MSMGRREVLALGAASGLAGMLGSPAAVAASAAPRRGVQGQSDVELARSLPGRFRNGYANVNGTRLHYVTGGRGAPLVLLPGWPRTWWEFRKVMPALAEHFQVIAVDMRGMGGSDKPAEGYDKKTMARDIHDLVRHLGHDTVDIVGSDIGAMVAFSFAANHPEATRKVTLLDVAHPEESLYELTLLPLPGQPFHLWWFAFNLVRDLPEQLLTGRFRAFIDWLCAAILHDQNSVDHQAREVFARAYDHPDAIRSGNAWYQAFAQDIIDDRTYSKIAAPLLGLAAEGNYAHLQNLLLSKAIDARVEKIDNAGHYLVEEQPGVVGAKLLDFHR